MSSIYPFQKLCHLSPRIVVAAAGSQLYGIDFDEQKICWRYPPLQNEPLQMDGSTSTVMADGTATSELASADEPACKRRKLDLASTEGTSEQETGVTSQQPDLSRRSSQESISITTDPRKKGERRKPKPMPSLNQMAANVTHMLTANGGDVLVVITAEDKAISTYDVGVNEQEGQYEELKLKSKRTMPKRIQAVSLTSRQGREYLIVGDKFGDVWEVPVLVDPNWVPQDIKQHEESRNDQDGGDGGAVSKGAYEPSATELTVHTKGNLMALEQQRKLKEKKAKERAKHGLDQVQAKQDDGPSGKGPGVDFEARLVLGHVSLLTDVTVASVSHKSENGKRTIRRYILSGDRDEHVRASRYPQSHVIEGYCLGMTDFVSCVRILPGNSQWAVVGTGEPALRVFDWTTGACLATEKFDVVELRARVSTQEGADSGKNSDETVFKTAFKALEEREGKVAVSRIWPVPVLSDDQSGVVLVALEGIPLLFDFRINYDKNAKSILSHVSTIPCPGNILDVVCRLGGRNVEDSPEVEIIVSCDTAHVPSSTSILAAESTGLLEATADIPKNLISVSFGGPHPKSMAAVPGKSALDLRIDHLPALNAAWSHVKDRSAMTTPSGAAGKEGEAAPTPGQRGGRKGPYSPMGEFLYGLENLRKKRGAAAAEEDPEEAEGELEVPEGVAET